MSRVRMFVLALGAVLAAMLALAGAASAHVTVSSPEATQGGYAVVTIRVPTESATASTTDLVFQLPKDTPLASVNVQPTPGWTATTTTDKLAKPITNDDGDQITEAVSQIEWKADSAATAIKPGQFQQFNVSVGPLPEKPEIVFKAIQTYSDKSVVRWIEQAAKGSSEEPDHPAPTLQLAAASGKDADSASSAVGSPAAAAKSSDSDGSSNTGPVVLSIIALVVAAGALGLAFVSRARGRGSA